MCYFIGPIGFYDRPMEEGRPLYFHFVLSSFYIRSPSFLFSSPILSRRRLDVYHTSTHDVAYSANFECKSETCCTRLAENTGRKKSPKIRHLRTIAQLCRAMSSQLRHVSTIGKKFSNVNISPTCLHNMVNFRPLAAEIGSRDWGTQQKFNVDRFRVLASLLQRRRSTEAN